MIPYGGPPSQHGKYPPINHVGPGNRSDRRRSRRKLAFILASVFLFLGWVPDTPYTPFFVLSGVLYAAGLYQWYLIHRDND